MKSDTLVIIDMQPKFAASQNARTIQACIREIKRAKRYRYGILVIEYSDCGSTDGRLLQKLKSYDRCYYFRKCKDDGSKEIISGIVQHRFSRKRLRLCGVNVCACVKDTAKGLIKKWPETDVAVVADGVNTIPSHQVEYYLDELEACGCRIVCRSNLRKAA